ncbi:MAG: NAD(P)H-dependent oxidoreductase [Saccharofermentanales bacterium]|jgi:FMN-dependent NADH-azoreductase
MTYDVLFVDGCIRKESSRTRRLAEAFVERLQARGDHAVERLVLTEEPLLPLTGDFFWQRERLLEAGDLDHARFRYAHRFARADKIVIAAPFWDLSFPALLKIYIENVSVQGITFDCDTTDGRLFGICRAEKMCYLTTRGGAYVDSSLETALPTLRNLATFFGIPAFDYVAADGIDLGHEPADVILARAIEEARAMADVW